jgi:hypothetical protein
MYLTRWGDPAVNRAELRRRIDAALVELTEREEWLRTGREAIERSVAVDKALIIQDPQVARLWVRYYSESNSLYFRASRELMRSLAEDDEETNHPEHPEHPEKADDEGSEGLAMAGSPNEPNDPSEPSLNDELPKSSDASTAAVLGSFSGINGATPVPPESNEPQVSAGPDGGSTGGTPVPPPAESVAAAPGAPNVRSPNEPNDPAPLRSNPTFVNIWVTKPAPVSGPHQGRGEAPNHQSLHGPRTRPLKGKGQAARRREAPSHGSHRRRDPRRTEPMSKSPTWWDQVPYMPTSELVPTCKQIARELKKKHASPRPTKGKATNLFRKGGSQTIGDKGYGG